MSKYRCGCELEHPKPSPNPNFCLPCYNALWRHALPQIPDGNSSTTAQPFTQDQEATCEWFDEQEVRWSLRDEGRNPDGTGESYAERNL